jgi:hypothetical protein
MFAGNSWRVWLLAELPAPEVERQRRHGMIFLRPATVAQEISDRFVGTSPQPTKRFRDDFFGVAMEFGNKRRQKAKGMPA